MTKVEIKEKLQKYIETGDDKLLKLMYVIAKQYNADKPAYEFDDTEINMLEERWENYKKGKSKGSSWEEVKENVFGKKKPE